MKTEKVRQLTGRRVRGRGWERSRIIRPQESLVLHKSFNTRWFPPWRCDGFFDGAEQQNPGAGCTSVGYQSGLDPTQPRGWHPHPVRLQPARLRQTTHNRGTLLQHSHSLFHANNATIIGAFCFYIFSKESSFKFSCSVAFASCFPVNCTVQVSSPAATPQTEDIVQESLAKGRTALLSPNMYFLLKFLK